VSNNGHEGGQMPIHMRLPKRGFNNIFRKNYEIVNLGRLQKAIDDKKLSAGAVNADALQQAGLIRNNKDGVRLLGQGELSAKIEIEVAGATNSAIAAVEGAGGKVILPEPTKVELEAREKSAKSQAKKDAAAPKKAAADDDAEAEADAPAAEEGGDEE
jgi:large subunit ribosomal protein L15